MGDAPVGAVGVAVTGDTVPGVARIPGVLFRPKAAIIAELWRVIPPPSTVGAARQDGSVPLDPLDNFTHATRTWFEEVFAAPTQAQQGAWQAISAGDNALVIAPTGSGKTLAAFLWALDRLTRDAIPPAKQRCRVLYVSPLKALAVDVERNLRAPLTGITQVALRSGQPPPSVTVAVRSGDTAASERRAIATRPPDILITTPESLFLMLTSSAREVLRHVETVIVDEVHALAGTKRGAHLALSLERLDQLVVDSGGAPTCSTDRVVGNCPAAGAGRSIPGRTTPGPGRRPTGGQILGPLDRGPGRGHERSRRIRGSGSPRVSARD